MQRMLKVAFLGLHSTHTLGVVTFTLIPTFDQFFLLFTERRRNFCHFRWCNL